MDSMQQSRSDVGAVLAAVNDVLWVDTNDVCNLKCPTCIRGVRGMVNSGTRLPVDRFQEIVRKAASEGYKRIGLFNWTEPFLNPDLARYMAAIKASGLGAALSSNFSLRTIPHLEEVLRVTDHLIISVSGFDQDVYAVNHVAGDIEQVKANLRRAADLKSTGKIATVLVLRLIRFAHNHAEEPKLRGFAEALGIDFEVIEGVGNPEHPLQGVTNESFLKRIDSVAVPEQNVPDKVCPLVFGQGSIDSKGDAYLCCAYPNYPSTRIGSYLEMSHEELLLARHHHRLCLSCSMPRRDATEADRQIYLHAVAATKHAEISIDVAAGTAGRPTGGWREWLWRRAS